MLNHHKSVGSIPELGSGVYVDVENLGGNEAAKGIIDGLIREWPDDIPEPSLLSLYVRADHVVLWNMWAESSFPDLVVRSNGIQHFSASQAKNSADIAIAVDAVSDILLERVAFVVVVSDDSDFIALYSRIKNEQSRLGFANGKAPFKWVVTDRPKTKSTTIKEFFPNKHTHMVSVAVSERNKRGAKAADALIQESSFNARTEENELYEAMAKAILEELPSGTFKSTETQRVIRDNWPEHPLANATKQSYGEEFRKRLLPFLEGHGVVEPNPNKKPREYEIPNIHAAPD